jgi:hypothetical protein
MEIWNRLFDKYTRKKRSDIPGDCQARTKPEEEEEEYEEMVVEEVEEVEQEEAKED